MVEQDQRNIAAVRRMYQGETAETSTIAPNIVWHVPGHSPVSGDYWRAGSAADVRRTP